MRSMRVIQHLSRRVATLTHCTPDEVLHAVSLSTWEVSGPRANLAALAALLHGKPGVAHVTAFGNTLHVTGEDEAALEQAIRPLRDDTTFAWKKSQAGLEDVFIHLMKGQVQ